MTRPAILGPLIDPAWAAQEINRLNAENERLRAREKLLDSVIQRQTLALMKIRTMQGDPIHIAREAMDHDEQEG